MRKHSVGITRKIRTQRKYERNRAITMSMVAKEIAEWDNHKKEVERLKINAVKGQGMQWSPKCDEEIEKQLREELIIKAKDSYVAWVRLCMGDEFVETPYHMYLLMVAEYAVKTAEAGKNVDITVSCPPQTGKSEMIPKHLPAWFLGRHPNCEAMVLTSDADLAKSFGDANRQKAIEYWGLVFGINTSKAFKSKTEIAVSDNSGVMRFKGLTSTVVGRGAVLNIVDDPYPGEEYVNSKALREKIVSIVRNDVFTRARGKGGLGCIRFVIHTRRHEEDLIGILDKEYTTAEESADGFARKKWFNITIPYFAVSENDPLGRKIGEALAPRMGKDVRWGLSKKSDIGLRAWNAQYMQNPMIENGVVFKKEWFKEYDKLPMMFENVILSCDLSNQEENNADFSAFQVWGIDDGNYYLLGRGKKRCSFNEQVAIIKQFMLKYPMTRTIVIEKKATGTAMADHITKATGYSVFGYDPGFRTKYSRASTASAPFENGRVYLPSEKKDPTIENYKNELLGFPNLAHDDEVDSTSQAILYLSERKGGRLVNEGNKLIDSVSNYLRS